MFLNLMISPFYPHLKKGYVYSNSAITLDDISNHQNIDLPLVIDTEFNTPFIKDGKRHNQNNPPRELISIQIKGIEESNKDALIIIPQRIKDIGYDRGVSIKYPIIKNEQSAIFDWLKLKGVEFKLKHEPRLLNGKYRQKIKPKKYKSLTICVYAHFALAELFFLANRAGENNYFYQTLYRAAINLQSNGNKVEMRKRLRVGIFAQNKSIVEFINLPFFIEINGERYILKLKIIDTCALHGISPYHDLLVVCGMDTSSKDLFSRGEKENMLETFFNRTLDFDRYARDDLSVYDIVKINANNYASIYEMLNLSPYYNEPKLTIGGTVAKMLESSAKHYLGVNAGDKEQEKIFEELLKPASTSWLKTQINTTKCLGAKVFGGRCRNNRPTIAQVFSLIIDIDIASCYGNGLRNQSYFVGIPVIEDYDISLKNNKYPSLGEWLAKRKWNTPDCELSYGAWQLTASTNDKELLDIPQDMLISWYGYDVKQILNSESELEVKSGITKIYKHEVKDAIVTHDIAEWIDNICSPKQRKELLSKLKVKLAIYYPNSGKLDSFEELVEKTELWIEENTTEANKKDNDAYKISKEINLPTYYVEMNLGELMIDNLLALRSFYKVVYGKGSTFDLLFKTNTNTTFGDLCSIFFKTSNAVCANNITARGRALCWYMEKGLYGIMSITDGCPFLINQVPYPYGKQQIYAEHFVDLYADSNPKNRKIQIKPLGGMKNINVGFTNEQLIHSDNQGEITTMDKDAGLNWISKKAFEHLQNLFPHVSVLHSHSTIIKLDIKNDKIKCNHNQETKYFSVDEIKAIEEIKKLIESDSKTITKQSLDNLKILFPQLSILHSPSTIAKIETIDKVEIIYFSDSAILEFKSINELQQSITPVIIKKDIEGMFEFEVKEWYQGGSFQGTSNYYLHNPNHPYKPEDDLVFKMRSYEKGKHTAISLNQNNELVENDFFLNYPPSKEFLVNQLWNNPDSINRSKVFCKQGILKINQFRQNQEIFADMGIVAGDNIKRYGLLRELSLSQFTFNTIKQHETIEREYSAMKRKYNQSYEMYFTDNKGKLNFQLMIDTIDEIIRNGGMSIKSILDKNKTRNNDYFHPENKVYEALNAKVIIDEYEDTGEFDLERLFEDDDNFDCSDNSDNSLDFLDDDMF